MEITEAQYERIKDALPVQRGNVRLSNLQVLNAVLYVAEQGCKWRGVPKRFGRWHTIYTRMNRWSKSGVLDRVFEKMQAEQIVRIKIEAFALDSTSIKVHPDGTGALKQTGLRPSASRAADGTPIPAVIRAAARLGAECRREFHFPRRRRRCSTSRPKLADVSSRSAGKTP